MGSKITQCFFVTKPVFNLDIGDQVFIGAGTPDRYRLAVYVDNKGNHRIDNSGVCIKNHDLVGYVIGVYKDT